MKLAKFFYCMRSIRISVLCTEDLQCVMVMVMKISVHTPVSLLLSARHPSGSQQPSQVSPAASPAFSDVWPSHGTSFLSAAEGLWVDWSLSCVFSCCAVLSRNVSGPCAPLMPQAALLPCVFGSFPQWRIIVFILQPLLWRGFRKVNTSIHKFLWPVSYAAVHLTIFPH